MGVTIISYEDESISNAQLTKELHLTDRTYTYIVSTSSLEKLRAGLCPKHQHINGEPILKFDKVFRNMVGLPLITRTEERICLQRAIKNAIEDPGVEKQVRHDLFSWLDALSELAQQNINLTNGIPEKLLDKFVSRATAEVLAKLQTEYFKVKASEKATNTRKTFEDAVNEFISNPILVSTFTSCIIMEGFTYLTPLQKNFVDTCLNNGAEIYFVYPYSEAQQRGFKIMEKTYGRFPSNKKHITTSHSLSTETALQLLKRNLFADIKPTETIIESTSVTLEAYPHRHIEVAACIKRISDYIKSGQYTADEIAIVARNPRELDNLLQEQARLQGLPSILSLPPRMLLLTPLGRFVLTLYNINRDGEFKMTPDQFEDIIASGWLGLIIQETTSTFSAVQYQLFEQCSSKQEWQDALNRLQKLPLCSADFRLPSNIVSLPTRKRWLDAFKKIETLCKRLFGHTEQTISKHIKKLLDELSLLNPEVIRTAEREIIEKIRQALEQVDSKSTLKVSSNEFGDVLNSLVKEYQQDVEAGNEIPENNKIWITTPEGIDSFVPPDGPKTSLKPKKVVFFLGVDDQRIPRRAPDPWPFFKDTVEENQNCERYLFLAVIRATGEKLHVSFAQRGENNTYKPSIYFEEVAEILNKKIIKVNPVLPPPDKTMSAKIPRYYSIQRDEYKLHEIAQFGLCPYRYKLERLDAQSRVCRDSFQMKFVAQGVWIDKVYEHIRGKVGKNKNEMERQLIKAVAETNGEIYLSFSSFRSLHLKAVEDQVRKSILKTVSIFARNEYPNTIIPISTPLVFEVMVEDRKITIDCDLRYAWHYTSENGRPLLASLIHQEWLVPSLGQDDRDIPPQEIIGGFSLFTNLYHAFNWWRGVIENNFVIKNSSASKQDKQNHESFKKRATTFIQGIEKGIYPKHPGDHCHVCPVKGLCLGIPED